MKNHTTFNSDSQVKRTSEMFVMIKAAANVEASEEHR